MTRDVPSQTEVITMYEVLQNYSQHLLERLDEKEQDLTVIQQKFTKLQKRFVDLDHAFKINLQIHQRMEIEFGRIKFENLELRKLGEEGLTRAAELNNEMMKMENEKDAIRQERNRWEEAFSKQKNAFESKILCLMEKYKSEMTKVRNEYDRTMRESQDLAKRNMMKMVENLEAQRKKTESIEETARVLNDQLNSIGLRMQKLADLIVTLPQVDANLESMLRRLANVLRSCSSEDACYKRRMEELCQETSCQITRMNKRNEVDILEHERLKDQNTVLKEIVKKFKRITQGAPKDDPVIAQSETENPQKPTSNPEPKIGNSKWTNSSQKSTIVMDNSAPATSQGCSSNDNGSQYKSTNFRTFENPDAKSNIILTPKIKRQHPIVKLSNGESLQLEFSGAQKGYQGPTAERIAVDLKNIEGIVKPRPKVTNCGVQTVEIHVSNIFTQTPPFKALGCKFHRVNASLKMLNTEKRAVQRSLCNVERTVSDLRCDTLDRARSLIGRKSGMLGNDEFFKCIQYLSG